MPTALLVLLLSGPPIESFYFLGYCLVYVLVDILLIRAVVRVYRGYGPRGRVYGLAGLSAAFGLYALADPGDSDWLLSFLIPLALPLACVVLAWCKRQQT